MNPSNPLPVGLTNRNAYHGRGGMILAMRNTIAICNCFDSWLRLIGGGFCQFWLTETYPQTRPIHIWPEIFQIDLKIRFGRDTKAHTLTNFLIDVTRLAQVAHSRLTPGGKWLPIRQREAADVCQ